MSVRRYGIYLRGLKFDIGIALLGIIALDRDVTL